MSKHICSESECGFNTDSWYEYQQHTGKIHGKRFPCFFDACPRMYIAKQDMVEHVGCYHYDDCFTCGNCQSKFDNRGSCNRHIKAKCKGAKVDLVLGTSKEQRLPFPEFPLCQKSGDVATTSRRTPDCTPLPPQLVAKRQIDDGRYSFYFSCFFIFSFSHYLLF